MMQNKRTLEKVLNELKKPEPNIDYIRGMVEVLVDEEEPAKIVSRDEAGVEILKNGFTTQFIPKEALKEATIDEAKILDNVAAASIEKIKALAGNQND